ncbi:MAG: hypothetical protein KR126chlam3_00201 [Chlamydiae bacterium]|nr:hypothetical protein [Chlamydiota bacterium]
MGKVTGFPKAHNADIIVVVVVLVDVQATRGEAPNNDKWTYADIHPVAPKPEAVFHLPLPLVFYLEIRIFMLLLTRYQHEVLS